MILHGYARVSTVDQDLTLQKQALRAAREGRAELGLLPDFLRAGDTLVITRVDRPARPLRGLQTSSTSFRVGVAACLIS